MTRRIRTPNWDELRSTGERQDLVVSRAQLEDLGWNHDNVQTELAARRWGARGEQAIVLNGAAPTKRQHWWIAVFNGGPEATLTGLSAAEEYGLKGFETEVVHIVVPRGAWVARHEGSVKVHISRRFTVADRHPSRTLPIVQFERGLIDAAVWSRNARRACAIVMAGVQQRLTRPGRLRETLDQQGAVRHRRLLSRILCDLEGGVHALSELDFARLCTQFRLPMPDRQVRRRDASGRIRYLDARFTRPDGSVLNVEIDGAAHLDVANAWDDMERDMDLLIGGESTVRFPAAVVRAEPERVARKLRQLLQ